jgi:hypothetical protein
MPEALAAVPSGVVCASERILGPAKTAGRARAPRRPDRLTRLVVLSVLVAASAPEAEARITRIVFNRVESPTFEGAAFGTAGQFEKLVGVAYGEVDPSRPQDAIIQDIQLAPRNGRGMVEYSTDIYIIKPVNMKRGNAVMVYEFTNRGGKILLHLLQRNVRGTAHDPATAGDGNLQKMGYTIVWSGWQADIRPGDGRMTIRVPKAINHDGSPITGVVRQEITVGSPTFSVAVNASRFTSAAIDVTYATANTNNRTPFPDGFLPTLTVRTRPEDSRLPIPNTAWAFGKCVRGVSVIPSDRDICLTNGDRFQPGRLYELIYRARDPLVMGLGYASVRDLIAFFKHSPRDDAGTPNPLWLGVDRTKAVTMGVSQAGRAVRTFLHLGFNEDEMGRTVFEGAFPYAASGRVPLNTRFSQGSRAWGHVSDADYPAYEFPFAYAPTRDPLTGRMDGILKRCLKTNTCPKIFHVATALEMWEGRQSLGMTDSMGRHDLPEPAFVRTYITGSTQHGVPSPMKGSRGGPFSECAQQTNPNSHVELARALWKAFTDWVRDGVPPPPSVVPRVDEGTLLLPSQFRFPPIPANTYEGIIRPAPRIFPQPNPLLVRHYGPSFYNYDESGIITVEPPAVDGTRRYTVLVPAVDADGNDIAGRLSTTLLAPLGTYTGWNFGRGDRWPDHLCSLAGSFIPFARAQAERLAVGDPRLSLEERYRDHRGYLDAVKAAARRLVGQRFLLPEDAERVINDAAASEVLQ